MGRTGEGLTLYSLQDNNGEFTREDVGVWWDGALPGVEFTVAQQWHWLVKTGVEGVMGFTHCTTAVGTFSGWFCQNFERALQETSLGTGWAIFWGVEPVVEAPLVLYITRVVRWISLQDGGGMESGCCFFSGVSLIGGKWQDFEGRRDGSGHVSLWHSLCHRGALPF